ncbi:MAG: MarR family winged helix-turn-helix transcriptional regulator [Candidatus Avispirillum sp.]
MPQRDIGYLIKNINDKMKVKADEDLKRCSLTLSQSRVVAFLDSCGGQATQKEIEIYADVSHPTVVGIVSRMEQKGFVTCGFDGKDRRNKTVRLTDRAEAIAAEMKLNIEKNERKMLASLSEDDTERLREMLEVIYGNLE